MAGRGCERMVFGGLRGFKKVRVATVRGSGSWVARFGEGLLGVGVWAMLCLCAYVVLTLCVVV